MRHIISILLENESGALSRVAGLFSARGYNIESLTVAPTEDPSLSRMTIVTRGSENIIEQIIKQLHKLINVIKITELDPGFAIEREIALVRVSVAAGKRGEVLEMATIFKAIAVDVGTNAITFQVTGTPAKINDFLELIRPYGIVDLVKSGRIAITREPKARKLRATG